MKTNMHNKLKGTITQKEDRKLKPGWLPCVTFIQPGNRLGIYSPMAHSSFARLTRRLPIHGLNDSRTWHLADWSTRGLDNLWTGQVADWTTRRCNRRLCVL